MYNLIDKFTKRHCVFHNFLQTHFFSISFDFTGFFLFFSGTLHVFLSILVTIFLVPSKTFSNLGQSL